MRPDHRQDRDNSGEEGTNRIPKTDLLFNSVYYVIKMRI